MSLETEDKSIRQFQGELRMAISNLASDQEFGLLGKELQQFSESPLVKRIIDLGVVTLNETGELVEYFVTNHLSNWEKIKNRLGLECRLKPRHTAKRVVNIVEKTLSRLGQEGETFLDRLRDGMPLPEAAAAYAMFVSPELVSRNSGSTEFGIEELLGLIVVGSILGSGGKGPKPPLGGRTAQDLHRSVMSPSDPNIPRTRRN